MAEQSVIPLRRRATGPVVRADVIGACDSDGCTAQRLGEPPPGAVLSVRDLAVAYEGRMRPEEKRHQPWIDGQFTKIMNGFKAFDARVDELSGDFTMDQVALVAACGHVDFRHGQLGWRDQCPALAGWLDGVSDRPSVAATVPA